MDIKERILADFSSRYGAGAAAVVRSPGRVNLIGEHTDYNDGYVFPMAIDLATWIALRPRDDGRLVLHALDHDETLECDLSNLTREAMSWREYPRGVAHVLREAGYTLRGWEGVTACDIPMGTGLSSSASYELAVARAFAHVSGLAWDPKKMALLCQKAENDWVGVQCGVMDQMICALGEEGKAVFIDCRSLETQSAPLPKETSVLILDTGTRRGLVDSAYNERREQCRAAAAHFNVPALRDLDVKTFVSRADELDEVTRKRSRHVVSENQRTRHALEAMKNDDAVRLGRLMNESHISLRDDFEVTNRELDIMARIARAQKGCLGARMTGAGFGGCAIALVHASEAVPLARAIGIAYREESGLEPAVYVTSPAKGVHAQEIEVG